MNIRIVLTFADIGTWWKTFSRYILRRHTEEWPEPSIRRIHARACDLHAHFFSIMTRLFVIFFRLAFFSGSFSGFFSGSVRESGTPSVRPSENLPLHVCKFKVTGPRWFCTCFGRPPAVAPVHGKDDRGPPGRLHSFCNRSRLNNRYMVRCH